jgi:hypothetical protein
MSIRSLESPGGPPPRTNGTPSGYRNIRVLTPNPLHFRLVAYAGLSMCSLNEFILKVLHLATPIDPATGFPFPAEARETAPGQRPGLDLIEGPGAAPGRGAAQSAKEPVPCHRPGHGPQDSPGLAARPGAAPPPEALAGSRLDRAVSPVLSGSIPTEDDAQSPPGQGPAKSGGPDHV